MKFNKFGRHGLAAALALGLCGTVAYAQTPPAPAAPVAQEVTPSHMEAARKTIVALAATDPFDSILPQAAAQLKAELIRKNPDLSSAIIQAVDEQTLALAARRRDLETEVARVYTRIFNEDELNAIGTFYASPAGKKLLEEGPIVAREVMQAAEIWQRGVARDLAQSVGEKLKAVYEARGEAAPAAPAAPAPAAPAAPAR
jgi:hypothetical protein